MRIPIMHTFINLALVPANRVSTLAISASGLPCAFESAFYFCNFEHYCCCPHLENLF